MTDFVNYTLCVSDAFSNVKSAVAFRSSYDLFTTNKYLVRTFFHNNKMIALDKIPDVIGFLVLTQDGAVLSSGGELENDEHRANIINGLINITDKWVSFGVIKIIVDKSSLL